MRKPIFNRLSDAVDHCIKTREDALEVIRDLHGEHIERLAMQMLLQRDIDQGGGWD